MTSIPMSFDGVKRSADIPKFLLWLDLETTGLDPNNGRILEYAVRCTDMNLRQLFAANSIVFQNAENAKALMHSDVLQMHTENKLLDELTICGKGCYYEDFIKTAEHKILEYISIHLPPIHHLIIAGSSIHFDKEWIKHDWPTLYSKLHYRNFDVSVFAMAFPAKLGPKPILVHRAQKDLEDSVALYEKMISVVGA